MTDLIICLNPSPCTPNITLELPFDKVNILVMNEHETNALSSQIQGDYNLKLSSLLNQYPNLIIAITTLGAYGAVAAVKTEEAIQFIAVPVLRPVKVVDSTGAGDCFTGYFMASMVKELAHANARLSLGNVDAVKRSMQIAILASGLSCEKPSAIPSIPKFADCLKYF
jgi:ribokinase